MDTIDQERLQWIKGDKIGTVETISGIDGEWTKFESGNRISTDLISEFLIPINEEPLDFDPPNPALIKAAETYKERVITQPKVASPIRTLFDKQKKNDKTKINISLTVEVPKQNIYEIISSSFDTDEVHQELKAYIKDQVDNSLIEGWIQESIDELISKRFKS